MSELLDAVDALTRPTTEHHPQDDNTGNYHHTHTNTMPPLLEQLRDAINPSNNTASGSASLKSTRNLIDADALYRYTVICSQIGDWCQQVHVARSKDPVVDLRRWYVAFKLVDPGTGWHKSELGKWARMIEDLLQPPKRLEVTAPCPVCNAVTWVDRDGMVMPHPVSVEYRLPKDGESIRPKATCRNADCGAVWDTIESLEELGDELKEKFSTKTAA